MNWLLKEVFWLSSNKDNKKEAIHLAIKSGHLEVVKCLLGKETLTSDVLCTALKSDQKEIASMLTRNCGNYKADIDGLNKEGFSVMHLAIQENRFDFVTFLMNHGANIDKPNVKGQNALLIATESLNFDLVKHLIEHGASVFQKNKDGQNAVEFIQSKMLSNELSGTERQKGKKIFDLLADKFNLEFRDLTPKYKACLSHSNLEKFSVKIIQKYEELFKDFIGHCITGNIVKIRKMIHSNRMTQKLFLRYNAQDFYTKFRAIDFAILKGHPDTVKSLIDYGAEIDTPEPEKTIKHIRRGLDLAILNGDKAMIKCLLTHGAKIEDHVYFAVNNEQIEIAKMLLISDGVIDKLFKNGFNILQWAAKRNRLDLVKLFISCGADPNARSGWKCHCRTALHLASENHNSEIVEFLIEQGADVFQEDINRQTPLDLAKKGLFTCHVLNQDGPPKSQQVGPSANVAKERVCQILDTKMKSLDASKSLQQNDTGMPRKRPRIENGQSPIEKVVSPLINSFLDQTFPLETKIACFHAIAALVNKDSNVHEFLVKKVVINEIAKVVGEIVSTAGNINEVNRDLETIAKVLSIINFNEEGKKMIGEMKMSLTAFQKLQFEMKKFENDSDPRHFAFDSDQRIKKFRSDILE